MSRPVHFEVQADDVERAKAFYGAVFGWEFQDYSAIDRLDVLGRHHRAEGRSRASTAGCCSGRRRSRRTARAPTRTS